MKILFVGLFIISFAAMAKDSGVREGMYQDGNMTVKVSVGKNLNGKSQLLLKYSDSKETIKFPLTPNECVKQSDRLNSILLFAYNDGVKFTTCLNENSNGKLKGTRKFETYTKILGVNAQLGEVPQYESESAYEMSITNDEISVQYDNAYHLRNMHLKKIN